MRNFQFVDRLYDLSIIGDINLDEVDRDFVEFMFKHVRYSKDINENLFKLKEKLETYDYSEQIRY